MGFFSFFFPVFLGRDGVWLSCRTGKVGGSSLGPVLALKQGFLFPRLFLFSCPTAWDEELQLQCGNSSFWGAWAWVYPNLVMKPWLFRPSSGSRPASGRPVWIWAYAVELPFPLPSSPCTDPDLLCKTVYPRFCSGWLLCSATSQNVAQTLIMEKASGLLSNSSFTSFLLATVWGALWAQPSWKQNGGLWEEAAHWRAYIPYTSA